MVTGNAHANHEQASASLRRSTIILDAFARLDAFGDFSKERCWLSLMNRNGMLMAVRAAVMFHGWIVGISREISSILNHQPR